MAAQRDGGRWLHRSLEREDHSTFDPEEIGWSEGSPAFNRVQRLLLRLFGVRRFFRLRLRMVAS